MPRYFFDVYNDFDSRDDEGIELADLDAVRRQIRRTLPELVKDLSASQNAAQFRVDVRDDSGQRVVTSTILMVMQSIDDDDGLRQAPQVDHSEAFRQDHSR